MSKIQPYWQGALTLFMIIFTRTCTCNCGELSQDDTSARSRKFLTHRTGMMILRTQYSGPGVDQSVTCDIPGGGKKKYVARWCDDPSY